MDLAKLPPCPGLGGRLKLYKLDGALGSAGLEFDAADDNGK
jgi:hypothetical protein